jgi:hypothetical protein
MENLLMLSSLQALAARQKEQHHMADTPMSRPIFHAIAPRFAVGDAEQTLAFMSELVLPAHIGRRGL